MDVAMLRKISEFGELSWYTRFHASCDPYPNNLKVKVKVKVGFTTPPPPYSLHE